MHRHGYPMKCMAVILGVLGGVCAPWTEAEPLEAVATAVGPGVHEMLPIEEAELNAWRQEIPVRHKVFSTHSGILPYWPFSTAGEESLRSASLVRGGVFSSRLQQYMSARPRDWKLLWKGTDPKSSFEWGPLILRFRRSTPPSAVAAGGDSAAGSSVGTPAAAASAAPQSPQTFEIHARVHPDYVNFFHPTSRDKRCRDGVAFLTRIDSSASVAQVLWCDAANEQGIVLYAPYRDPESTATGFVVCPRAVEGDKLTEVTQLKDSGYRPAELLTDVTARLQVRLVTGRAEGYVMGSIRTGGVLPPSSRSIDEVQSVDPEAETWYSSAKERTALNAMGSSAVSRSPTPRPAAPQPAAPQPAAPQPAASESAAPDSTIRDKLWAGISLVAAQHYETNHMRLIEFREAVRVEPLAGVAEQSFPELKIGRHITVKSGAGICFAVIYREQIKREGYFDTPFRTPVE